MRTTFLATIIMYCLMAIPLSAGESQTVSGKLPYEKIVKTLGQFIKFNETKDGFEAKTDDKSVEVLLVGTKQKLAKAVLVSYLAGDNLSEKIKERNTLFLSAFMLSLGVAEKDAQAYLKRALTSDKKHEEKLSGLSVTFAVNGNYAVIVAQPGGTTKYDAMSLKQLAIHINENLISLQGVKQEAIWKTVYRFIILSQASTAKVQLRNYNLYAATKGECKIAVLALYDKFGLKEAAIADAGERLGQVEPTGGPSAPYLPGKGIEVKARDTRYLDKLKPNAKLMVHTRSGKRLDCTFISKPSTFILNVLYQGKKYPCRMRDVTEIRADGQVIYSEKGVIGKPAPPSKPSVATKKPEKDSKKAAMWLRMAQQYLKARNLAKAMEYARKIVAHHPQSKEAEEARDIIEMGK